MEKELKLTKKQKKDIAKMWAGSVLLSFELDSFSGKYNTKDEDEIIDMVHSFGAKMLGKRPNIVNLNEIINYVSNK